MDFKTPIWRCAGIVGGIVVAIWIFGEFLTYRSTHVTSVDRRIAEESLKLIETTLVSLPDNDELIRRYGRLKSLRAGELRRRPSIRGVTPSMGSIRASLSFTCIGECEKYPVEISVGILEADKNFRPQLQPVPFSVTPTAEQLTTAAKQAHQSKAKLEVIDDQLHYVFAGPNGVRIPCYVGCTIKHPEFVP